MKDENTITIDIYLTRRLVALLALALLIVAGLGYLAWGRSEASASGSQAPLASSAGMRQYYLTTSTYTGAAARLSSVCAVGYHFASLWEILDPASLKYNTSLGYNRADSGQGPPTFRPGWIRTGYEADTSSTIGRANCWNWVSNNTIYNGTTVHLPSDWTATTDPHVWIASSYSCDTSRPVWCVADNVGGSVYLPIVMK